MIKFILLTTHETKNALVDSRATENFLDPRTISRMELPMQKLDKEQAIHNIDGIFNSTGKITQKCTLKVQVGELIKEMEFFITNLGGDCVVLGYPFLKEFNPQINWEKGEITRARQVKVTPKQIWEH